MPSEEPRYCVKCGKKMELGDAAHPYGCDGPGDCANPAPFQSKPKRASRAKRKYFRWWKNVPT